MPATVPEKTKNEKRTRRIEVLRPGTFRAMNGEDVSFTGQDLTAIASSYDAKSNPAPVVIGHPKTDDPAYGWIENFSYDDEKERLFADVGEMDPAFEDAVAGGRYKRVSLSFHMPGSPANPNPKNLYPKHLGFLGGKAPAVSGLKPVVFSGSDKEALTFEFAELAEPAFRDVAGLFRKLREWFIENHDKETADSVLSDWQINWIGRAADENPETEFSEPEEEIMSKPSNKGGEPSADFAEREAAIEAREQQLAERERTARHDSNLAFADGLVGEARLPKPLSGKLVSLLDALGEGEPDPVSFADGDKTKQEQPADLLKEILKSLPPMVEFGEFDMGEEPEANSSADFATVGDEEVDGGSLAIHRKALAYQKKNPGTDYDSAIAAVS